MEVYLKRQRSRDILSAYERALRELRHLKDIGSLRQKSIEKAMSYNAPRFYISFSMCRRVISLMNRGLDPHVTNPLRLEMYKEILRRYKKRGEKGYSCLRDILEEEAPSFYIDKYTFYQAVLNSLKRK